MCAASTHAHTFFPSIVCVLVRTRFLLNWHHHHSILVISFSGLFIYGLPSTTIFNVIQAFNRRISLTHLHSVFFSSIPSGILFQILYTFLFITLIQPIEIPSSIRKTKKRWINTNWISRLDSSLSINLSRSRSHILSRTNSKRTTKSTKRSIDKHYNNYFDGNEMNITLDM